MVELVHSVIEPRFTKECQKNVAKSSGYGHCEDISNGADNVSKHGSAWWTFDEFREVRMRCWSTAGI